MENIKDYNARSVLGAMLLCNPEIIQKGLRIIQEEDFEQLNYKKIFNAIKKAFEAGPVDFVTIANNLPADFNNMLTELIDFVPSTANFDEYCKQLRQERKLRELYVGLGKIIKRIGDDTNAANVDSYITEAQTLTDQMKTIGLSSIEAVGDDIFQAFDELNDIEQYVSTGFSGIDNTVRGLSAGKLFVIGGRPSMGKSSLAMNIAANVVLKDNPVLYFTIEDSKNELLRRCCTTRDL